MTPPPKPRSGPVRIAVQDPKITAGAPSGHGPAEAPPVPEICEGSPAQAAPPPPRIGAARMSFLARAFWGLLGVLVTMLAGQWAFDTLIALLAKDSVLGRMLLGAALLFGLVLLGIFLRELAGFSRLRRLDRLRERADRLRAQTGNGRAGAGQTGNGPAGAGPRGQAGRVSGDARGDTGGDTGFGGGITAAADFGNALRRLYLDRPDVSWGLANAQDKLAASFETADVLDILETTVLAPLDTAALREVEGAARQVATVTALVPLALADVAVALVANMRMIRRVAMLYGGRTGVLGSWRLLRAVTAHLVATGVVAAGDDLIGSLAGGSVLAKFSRRFGEGLVNGALTARVGVAAMEVCRPMPFVAQKKPRVSKVLSGALGGVFGRETST